MVFEERRRFPRYGLQADVEIEFEGKVLRTFLSDVSVGGAFIILADPLWVGANVKLRILLGEPIRAACVVRRVVVGRGMGLMFTEMSEEDKGRLFQLIAALAV
jgi:c-di-GMP-binding flagellar brake protein YcgR